MGYWRAGFDVVGVDIKPQPRYPFEFHQADALAYATEHAWGFHAIHASPPCQRFTAMVQARHLEHKHPDYIAAVRAVLEASGLPYVIENVPRAPLKKTLTLTGDMFGMDTYRKRIFESNRLVLAPDIGAPFGPISRPGSETIVGHPGGHSRRDRRGERRMRGTLKRWREIMGIDWMRGHELVEAIPPAYTEFIGRQLIACL